MDDYTPTNDKSTPVENRPSGVPLFDFLTQIAATGNISKGWRGHCPIHEDTRASFNVNVDQETSTVLVRCFVCGPDTQSGLKMRGLWPILTPEKEKMLEHKTARKFSYTWIPKTDKLIPEPPDISGHAHAGSWNYLDTDGDIMGRVYRYEALADPSPGQKRAKQFRPHFYFMAHNGPVWMLKMPVPRPLYNLPSLMNPGPVLLVEGEKTADGAQLIFPTMAVVSPMGGLQGLSGSDLSLLKNREIIMWPDADQNWERNAESWRNVLVQHQCSKVSCVKLLARLVKEHEKWDLADPVPEWFSVKEAFKELLTYEISNRDPIDSITKAEDLKTRYVHVGEGGEKNTFVFIETGHEMSQSVFDATFRRLTTKRDFGMPSRWYLDAADRQASLAGKTYVPKGSRIISENNKKLYNTYCPPLITPLEGDVQPLLDHVNWMLNEEDAVELMCRFANMVQNPERRPLSAYVLQGAQGIGKNILFEAFKPIVGVDNFYITDPSSVFSDYNYYAVGRVMLVLNEMTDQERHEMYDILKPLITDLTIEVRQKYRPAYMVPNTAHIFCMTNYSRPIKLPDADERRFYIAEAIQKKPKDQDYYQKLFEWLRTHSAEMMDYFMKFNLNGWSPEARPKMTDAKMKVVKLSKPAGMIRFEEMLAEGDFEYDLYTREQLLRLLYANGVLPSEKNYVQADRMFAEHNITLLHAARPKAPGGHEGLKNVALICFRNSERYIVMKKAELWRAYEAERNNHGESF